MDPNAWRCVLLKGRKKESECAYVCVFAFCHPVLFTESCFSLPLVLLNDRTFCCCCCCRCCYSRFWCCVSTCILVVCVWVRVSQRVCVWPPEPPEKALIISLWMEKERLMACVDHCVCIPFGVDRVSVDSHDAYKKRGEKSSQRTLRSSRFMNSQVICMFLPLITCVITWFVTPHLVFPGKN